MSEGYSQAATYILTEASEDELNVFFEHIKSRRKMLAQQRTAGLRAGDRVTIEGISPKFLEGLTGVIKDLQERRGRRKAYVEVKLDKASTARLKITSAGSSRIYIPENTEEYILSGVPMSCLRPR